MLTNLRTIHKPQSLDEAAELLKHLSFYPVYGGGASLFRTDGRDVEAVVDLSTLIPPQIELNATDGAYRIAATVKLADIQGQLQRIIAEDMPETLRNTLTVGDELLECRPDSLLLAALSITQRVNVGIVTHRSTDSLSIDDWYNLSPEERQELVVSEIIVPQELYEGTVAPLAFEKVSRTPKDKPIVAALAVHQLAVVIGLADRPVLYREVMQSQISDYRGSAEYRTAMARVVVERAVTKSFAQATGNGGKV
jgi:CO/xanthine dehydrogenase FAD-binding subunit